MFEENDTETQYQVVVNHEAQYSIWPADREPPSGWNGVGKIGPRQACLEHINLVWTDMRPRSLREQMAKAEAGEESVP